jgi:predicted esterase
MKSTPAQLSYTHNYIAAQNVNHSLTLLLLHGTGGDEFEMIPLGRTLDPAVNILSPRGNVLENGQARFFRRLSEGVFDREDLLKHTRDLAEFIENASAQYGFDLDKVVAAGYSNGANIAASLLLLYPRLLAGAILFRPMIPIKTKVDPDLSQIPI